ncbi:hypothetical protein DFH09DRAFT_1379679 [Mycena vulgaris]|nr:hypothetical protein DFH09DRAFT_1379679 [Mycena vulgaris]
MARGGCRCHPLAPPPTQLPAPSGPSLAAFQDVQAYARRVPDTIERTRIAALQQHEDAAIMAARFPLPPSPSQEEDDLEYALQLSLVPSPVLPPHQTRTASTSRSAASTSAQSSIPEATHRFLLVFWPRNGQPARVQAIQDLPIWPQHWPKLRLADIADILKTGISSDVDDCYETFAYGTWITVPVGWSHTIVTDQPLFIRRLGVVGSDQQEQLEHLNTPQSSTTMPAEKRDDEVVIVAEQTLSIPRYVSPPTPPTPALSYTSTPSLPTPTQKTPHTRSKADIIIIDDSSEDESKPDDRKRKREAITKSGRSSSPDSFSLSYRPYGRARERVIKQEPMTPPRKRPHLSARIPSSSSSSTASSTSLPISQLSPIFPSSIPLPPLRYCY